METLTENRLNERHSIGSVISGSPEVLYATTQWIWIARNGAITHLNTAGGPPVGNHWSRANDRRPNSPIRIKSRICRSWPFYWQNNMALI